MSQEIEITKRCLCLRNGNEVWISEETYLKIKQATENATSSMMIYISELDNKGLSTADIVETCTASEMEDKRRIARGEYKCAYNKWHKKREKCFCLREITDKKREKLKLKKDNKPLTAEQKKQRAKNVKANRDWAKTRPYLNGKARAEESSDEGIKYSKDGICIVCRKNKLGDHCANVCGSDCMKERDLNPEKYNKYLK